MGGRYQAGFVRHSTLALAMLLLGILAAIGIWAGISDLISGEFALSFFMAWLTALAAAGWMSREQPRVLRTPVGLLVFLGLALVLAPLSWWSQSKLAVGAEAAVAAAGAWYLGGLWSRRLTPRLSAPAWYLDQSIDLVADLFRWIGVCAVAWFAVAVPPLMLVFAMPIDWVTWVAMAWALACMAGYDYKFRPSRLRFLKVPLGLWVFAITALLLQLFQKEIVGPMEPGSIGQIAYGAYAPVAAALFVEIVGVGTPKTPSSTA